MHQNRMWNNYFNRPRRDVPQVNYNESSEDEYDSPLVSPSRPPPTRAASPVELAVPTLNDNVDEELQAVSQTLQNVGRTHTFRNTRPHIRPEPEGGASQGPEEPNSSISTCHDGDEEVVKGEVVGNPSGGGNFDNMPPIHVNYDAATADADEDGAIGNARDIKIPFNKHDIKLWFSLIESKMQFAGLKRQWSKRQVLVQLIPAELHTDFRYYLELQENEAGDSAYLEFKKAICKQFGLKRAENFDKAISRVMTGTPSQLGRQVMADICPSRQPLRNCHCADIVLGIWRRSLPQVVRNAIADMDFDADTWRQAFDRADNVWQSNAASTSVVATLERTAAANPSSEVAAVSAKNKKNKKNKNQNSGNSGGGSNSNANSNGGSKPNRGPRHPDNPPQGSCGLHWKFGKGAWTCADRHNCPWRDYESPRPRHDRNIGATEIVD